MITNHISLLRRILASLTIFCLMMSDVGVQPARAQDLGPTEYEIRSAFHVLPDPVCTKEKVTVTLYFMVVLKSGLSPLTPFKAKVIAKADVGTIKPQASPPISVWINQMGTADFTYVSTEKTFATIHMTILVPGLRDGENDKSFNVAPCKLNVHGSSNMGGPINAMMPTKVWEAVGNYDIAGTLEAQEDGSLKGEAVASAYLDAIFMGGAGDVTCQHITPWEGNTKVDLEADPNAWAKEGVLDLQLAVQPMQVNTTQIVCTAPNGGGSGSSPPFTVASFDLNFASLPSEGGTTGLDFQFPNGRATFHIDLIVSPEEAGS